MRFQLLSISCAFIGGLLIRSVDGSCYYPDGTFPEDYVYVPCSGDEFTTCCILSEGDQCLSNGLCYYPGSSGYMFRGACTDKTWQSEGCFQHCKTGDMTGSYDQLVSCGGDKYCCYSDGSTCCNDDSKVFTVAAATVIKDLATLTSGTNSLPIETPTVIPDSGSYTSTLLSSSAKPTSTESREGETTAKTTGSKATSTAAGATSTSTSEVSKSEESSGPSHTALIGGAVGGVVVLIIAIGLVWFFVRRRYRKKLAAGTNPQSFPMSTDGFQKLPDKSPRPVEVPAPLHAPQPPQSPAPPYQPPAYQNQHPQHNAVEIDNSYLPPGRNQWGNPVYEAPAQPYGRF